jgi:hypothetical protein
MEASKSKRILDKEYSKELIVRCTRAQEPEKEIEQPL